MIDPKKFTPLSTTAATAFSTYSRDEIRVKEAQQLKEISCEKVKYTTIQHDNISTSNSVIVYTSHGQAMGENFGEIHEIFIHMDQNLYFLVKSFGELRKEHKQYDPFQKHPDLRAKMLYEKDGCSFEIITFEDIISHAAIWRGYITGLSVPCVIVLSLDRVVSFSNHDLIYRSLKGRLHSEVDGLVLKTRSHGKCVFNH